MPPVGMPSGVHRCAATMRDHLFVRVPRGSEKLKFEAKIAQIYSAMRILAHALSLQSLLVF
jgi:hypothetical protein